MTTRKAAEVEIRPATAADAQRIVAWRVEEDGPEVLELSRDTIEGALQDGELSVAAACGDGELLGYCVAGDGSIDILEVSTEHRRKGVGRMLAHEALERIERSGAFGVAIMCLPAESFEFWKTLGFTQVGPPGWLGERAAALGFGHRHSLPKDARRLAVCVELERDTGPIEDVVTQSFTTQGAEVPSGAVLLESRVAAFVIDGETTVSIRLDEIELCKCRVKDAWRYGVKYREPFIRIDRIRAVKSDA